MRRREFIVAGGATFAWHLTAEAQQPDQLRRIGVLMATFESDPAAQARLAALRSALERLGWKEGSNLRIDVRWCSDIKLFVQCAAELVAFGPDVLIGEATPGVAALRRETQTIPIVFAGILDPVGQGFVASLAHPAGNMTGLSLFDAPMAGKWLEMLTRISPPVAQVAVLSNPATTPPGWTKTVLASVVEAASSTAVTVTAVPVNTDAELYDSLARVARQEHGSLLVLPDVFTMTHRDAIISLAARYRLPAVYSFRIFAEAGGLMSYGVDPADVLPRTADYVDRILKGVKPGDLPVQRPTKFDLVINLKAAKALNVTIAPSLLATADEVIE